MKMVAWVVVIAKEITVKMMMIALLILAVTPPCVLLVQVIHEICHALIAMSLTG
jgi:hypothetical protein